jgi:hypothetical protein
MSLGSGIVGEIINNRMGDHVLDQNVVALLLDVEDSLGGGGHVVLSEKERIKFSFLQFIKSIFLSIVEKSPKIESKNSILRFTK